MRNDKRMTSLCEKRMDYKRIKTAVASVIKLFRIFLYWDMRDIRILLREDRPPSVQEPARRQHIRKPGLLVVKGQLYDAHHAGFTPRIHPHMGAPCRKIHRAEDSSFPYGKTDRLFLGVSLLCQEAGIPIIGEQSAGGTCNLVFFKMDLGSQYSMSAFRTFNYMRGGDLEAGATPDYDITKKKSKYEL